MLHTRQQLNHNPTRERGAKSPSLTRRVAIYSAVSFMGDGLQSSSDIPLRRKSSATCGKQRVPQMSNALRYAKCSLPVKRSQFFEYRGIRLCKKGDEDKSSKEDTHCRISWRKDVHSLATHDLGDRMPLWTLGDRIVSPIMDDSWAY